jgi:hypothetical protein
MNGYSMSNCNSNSIWRVAGLLHLTIRVCSAVRTSALHHIASHHITSTYLTTVYTASFQTSLFAVPLMDRKEHTYVTFTCTLQVTRSLRCLSARSTCTNRNLSPPLFIRSSDEATKIEHSIASFPYMAMVYICHAVFSILLDILHHMYQI